MLDRSLIAPVSVLAALACVVAIVVGFLRSEEPTAAMSLAMDGALLLAAGAGIRGMLAARGDGNPAMKQSRNASLIAVFLICAAVSMGAGWAGGAAGLLAMAAMSLAWLNVDVDQEEDGTENWSPPTPEVNRVDGDDPGELA